MDVRERIEELKEEKNAIILAHNYQVREVQEVADYVGDSFGLSLRASETDAEVIVFCGVDFMAESAKLLSPSRTVLLPEMEARCPMAAMCTADAIAEMRARYPKAAVVGYVNTSADCKAEMDYCCTSANAVKVVKSVPQDQVIFAPDMNLGRYVQRFVDKEIILWPGFCPTHQAITVEQISSEMEKLPGAVVIVHPECRPEVIDRADFVGSTEQMIRYVKDSPIKEFIIGTEVDIVNRLAKEAPAGSYNTLGSAVCPTMKMTSPRSILQALERMAPTIELSSETMRRASVPLRRMIEIGK